MHAHISLIFIFRNIFYGLLQIKIQILTIKYTFMYNMQIHALQFCLIISMGPLR